MKRQGTESQSAAGIVQGRALPVLASLLGLSVLGIWLAPRGIALYQQVRGGRLLAQAAEVSLAGGGSATQEGWRDLLAEPSVDPHVLMLAEEAAAHFETATLFNANLSHAYLLMGRAHMLLGDHRAAIEGFRQYILLRPVGPLGHWELALALEAVCRHQAGAEGTADSGYALVLGGPCTDAARQAEIAVEWRAAGLEADDFLDAADRAREAERHEEALAAYERAAWLGSPEAESYYALTKGLLYQEQRLWIEAIEVFKAMLENGKDGAIPLGTVYYHIGLVQQVHLDQWDDALMTFEKAVETQNFLSAWDSADAHYRRGVIYKYAGQKPHALREFQLAVAALAHHYGALVELGGAYWELGGNLPLAEAALEKAISAGPEGKWAYAALGDVYWSANMLDKAQMMYQKALTLDPSDKEIRQKLRELSSH